MVKEASHRMDTVCLLSDANTCRIRVHVQDGVITKITPVDFSDPICKGACQKGLSAHHWAYHFRIRGKDVAPPAKGGLRVLLGSAVDNGSEVEEILTAFRRDIKEGAPFPEAPFSQWLGQYTKSEAVFDLFNALVEAQLGTNISESKTNEVFRWFMAGSFREYGIPHHGLIPLTDNLLRTIKDNAGDLWAQCDVKQILVEKGSAKRVIVQKRRSNPKDRRPDGHL